MNYLEWHSVSGFRVGDMVVVSRKCESNEAGWCMPWIVDMDYRVGTTGEIVYDDCECGFLVDFGDRSALFPFFALVHVSDWKGGKDEWYQF